VCPKRLSLGAVKGIRYALQAAFRDLGRTLPYDPLSKLGNPLNSAEVKLFIAAIAMEQTNSRVSTPPLRRFSDAEMRILLTQSLENWVGADAIDDKLSAFKWIQFALFLALDWATMERGLDLVETHVSQCALIPPADGSEGFTLRYHSSRRKTVRKPADIGPPIDILPSGDECDVANIFRCHLEAALALGTDLGTGPLFLAVRLHKRNGNPPGIGGPLTTAALRKQLASLCVSTGVPHAALHASRRGKSSSLIAVGECPKKIKVVGGWKSNKVAYDYMGISASKRHRTISPPASS
jgi:hypothetical protein